MTLRQHDRSSPWPHRLAVVLALVTFPLIWVGGLVTTYDAGMAVPDWPGTYGYNLLVYPWQSWIAAPWDLFIEHGHRLLGAAAGLVAICLVVVAFFTDRRRWVRVTACLALALVILQGLLGGARVLLDQRLVALVHGCVGPLFFGYLAGLIVATSKWWEDAAPTTAAQGVRVARLAWMTPSVAYFQLVLGALIRHIPLAASPGLFRAALVLHLAGAAALAIQIGVASWSTSHLTAAAARGLTLPALLLPLLIAGQLLLGAATYVTKYSWPDWLGDYQFAAAYVVQEKSLLQSLIATAHVAMGSLILFVAVFLAGRATRVFQTTASTAQVNRRDDASAPPSLARCAA